MNREDVYPEKVCCKNCFAAFAPADLRLTAGHCPVCKMRVCPRCGCTDNRGCYSEEEGRACTWSDNYRTIAGSRFILLAYCDFCAHVIAAFEYSNAPAPQDVVAAAAATDGEAFRAVNVRSGEVKIFVQDPTTDPRWPDFVCEDDSVWSPLDLYREWRKEGHPDFEFYAGRQ